MSQEVMLTDAEAVQAVLCGRRDAFSVLVRRHLPTVKAFAFSRTSNFVDAEDVAQESFLRAFKYLNTLKDSKRFGPWVVAIAKNVSHRVLAQRVKQGEVAEQLRPGASAVMPDVERRDMQKLVLQHVNTLDETHRDVLLLYYFSGLSVAETAGALDIAPEAVKKRLQRARAALGTHLVNVLGTELCGHSKEDNEQRAARVMGIVALAIPVWQPMADMPLPDTGQAPPPAMAPTPLERLGKLTSMPGRSARKLVASLALIGVSIAVWLAGSGATGKPVELRNSQQPESAYQRHAMTNEIGTPGSQHAGESEKTSASSPSSPQGGMGYSAGGGTNRRRASHVVESTSGISTPRIPNRDSEVDRLGKALVARPKRLRANSDGRQMATVPHASAREGYLDKLKLKDVPLRTVLDVTLRQMDLDYIVEDDYIWVSSPERIRHEEREKAQSRFFDLNTGAYTLPKIVVRAP